MAGRMRTAFIVAVIFVGCDKHKDYRPFAAAVLAQHADTPEPPPNTKRAGGDERGDLGIADDAQPTPDTTSADIASDEQTPEVLRVQRRHNRPIRSFFRRR